MKRPKLKPTTTRLTEPFWEGIRAGRFPLQYDPAADRYQFYPRPISLYSNGDLEWRDAAGTGELIALSLCHSPAPGFEDEVPYLLGIMKLDEGPRLFAEVKGFGPDEAKIGHAAKIGFADRDGQPVYFITRADA